MFPLGGTLREPDFPERGVTTQVVDVPVRGASSSAVMGKSRRETARPAGAADVGIEAALEFDRSEGAYLDAAPERSLEDENVRTR